MKSVSWSEIARRIAKNQFAYYVAANECGDPESYLLEPNPHYHNYTLADKEYYIYMFSYSTRNKLVRVRVMKHFSRLVAKYQRG